MKRIKNIAILSFGYMLCSALLTTQLFATESYSAFLGDYAGTAETIIDGNKVNRNLEISISETKNGFKVDWSTTTLKPSGKYKKKNYSIKFLPTQRKNIFSSAMKTNLFGGQTAMDPMKGHPYVWARIVDQTLTIYALHVTDDGGYELQIYDRTLTKEGLDLKFARIRDGKPTRDIRGSMMRK